MKVEVFHNVSRDAFFGLNVVFEKDDTAPRGYVKRQARTTGEQHQLVKVFEYDTPETFDTVLDAAFERFNVGTDELAQAYRARRLRSLSVGDVLVLENPVKSGKTAAFSVEAAGFQLRGGDELQFVTDPSEAEALVRERYEFLSAEELNVTVPWTG